jgi:translation initiation factor IF-2
MKKEEEKKSIPKTDSALPKKVERPPVVVVMGHIDHGKSTLLDYIRKTNVVDKEAGGITQHLSAYEVIHKDKSGKEKKITFLDTPGHEAFEKMRFRGAEVADIAILVVSAEEGVKAQTLEAFESIKKSKIPYVIAINKIDRPNANIERTKNNLLEKEIYLEGLGGDVPWVPVSAKTGEGIPELLDLVLLVAELEELSGNPEKIAEGVVIESHSDSKKGISVTLLIKDGVLKTGMFISAGESTSPVRIMENFQGKAIKEAMFSSPIQVVGFSSVPQPGTIFASFKTKKDSEDAAICEIKEIKTYDISNKAAGTGTSSLVVIPVVLIIDAIGTLDAVEHEIKKLSDDNVCIKIVQKSVGAISENDIKTASGNKGTLVIGFNTSIDAHAQSLANQLGIEINIFNIIYKLSEWLNELVEKRKLEMKKEEVVGNAEILKVFSRVKDRQVIGGRVSIGSFSIKEEVKILRKNVEIGKAKILNLQKQKADVKDISDGSEFGAQIESKIEIAKGDMIERVSPVKH